MSSKWENCPELLSDPSDDSSDEIDCISGNHATVSTKVEHLKEKGNIYFGKGKYLEAIDKYEAALQINEVITAQDKKLDLYYKLKNNISQCYLKRKTWDKALDAAVDAIEAGSDQCKSYLRANIAFVNLNKPEYAYKVLKKGVIKCAHSNNEILLALNELQDKYPKVNKIKEMTWTKLDVKELAENVKKLPDLENEERLKKKKAAEEKKKIAKEAKEAKAREEEERKKREEIEKKEKEREERERRAKEEIEEKLLMSKLPQLSSQVKFNEYIKKGSEALQNKVALTAFDNMGRALELIKNDYDNLGWSKNLDVACNPDVVTIRYIYARAGVDTSVYENILIAKENFDLILTFHKSVRFPAVYYGLAVLYKKLNRFEESRKYVELGLSFIEKRLAYTSVNWPGLPTQPLQETLPDELHLILTKLRDELVAPPPPHAICRYGKCLTHKDQTHILPSENIYLSDPDYRGHFRLRCSENCHLDYHKVCWGLLKSDQDWQLSRVPTEKDFLGRPCLTPDCEGVVIKIEIFNQDGDVHPIEDIKLIEKLEEEAKRKKEEEKNRRLEEMKKSKDTNKDSTGTNKRKKKKKKSPGSPESENEVSESNSLKESEVETVKSLANSEESTKVEQVDYSKVDVSNAVVLNKKANENEGEVDSLAKKKKGGKRKGMSLEEFHAAANIAEPTVVDANVGGNENDFDSRIQKANKYKTFYEKIGPPVPTGHPPVVGHQSRPAQSSTPPVNNPWTKPRTSSSDGGVISAQIPAQTNQHNPPQNIEEIKGFIFGYLYDLLNQTGPIDHQDSRIWILLQEYKEVINSYDGGLRTLIYLDPENRFRHYGDYICLMDHLAVAIQMYQSKLDEEEIFLDDEEADTEEDENEVMQHLNEDINKNMVKNVSETETDESDKKWLEVKQLLGSRTANSQPTEQPKPFEMTGILNSLPDFNSALCADRKISAGVQTDVSSIELDDGGMDVFTLAQTNEALVAELQQEKDKNTRKQKENKVELAELRDKKNQLSEENARLKNDLNKMKETVFRSERIAQEFVDKEKALKDDRERVSQELASVKHQLEEELKLSFQLNNTLKKTTKEKDQEIRNLKILNLKVEHKYYTDLINTNIDNSRQCSKMLEELRHNPLFSQHASNINTAMIEMDEYSARLTHAKDEVEQLLNIKINNVANEKVPKLGFDIKKIGRPVLDINVFLDFMEANHSFGQKLNNAAAGRLPRNNQLSGPPPNLGAIGASTEFLGQSELLTGMKLSGLDSRLGPVNQLPGGAIPKEPLARHNLDASSGGAVSRGSTFSPPPISRPSAPSSPFHSAPGVRSPPPLLGGPGAPINRGAQQHQQLTMQPPIGTRLSGPPPTSTDFFGNVKPKEAQVTQIPPGIKNSGPLRPPVPFSMSQSDNLASSAPGGPLSGPGGPLRSQAQARPEASGDAMSDQGGRKKNEDKLLSRICEEIPDITYAQARDFVKRVREGNGGKLTGMSYATIVNKVSEFLRLEVQNKDCSICLSELMEDTVTPSCGHTFHKQCLDQWLQQEKSGNTCPNCREFITNDEEFPKLG